MTTTTDAQDDTKSRPPRGRWLPGFYRQSRMLHAYFSAFAFIALIFFSVTGLLLNHPEWLEGLHAQKSDRVVTLSADAVRTAVAAEDPGAALARVLEAQTDVLGVYASGEVLDGEGLLHFEGPRGATDATVDVASGRVEISTSTANPVTVLNDLHRGKNAGAAWRAVIDATAYVLLAMSIVGYILFFSLRFRLATSLVLTVLSLAAMAGVFILFVP